MMTNSRARPRERRGPITPVHYTPPAGFGLDLEILSAPELRRRAQREGFGGIERIEFHFVIYVASGGYRHMVDFERFECRAGQLLVTQPGQVHRFGPLPGWDGWLLMFRPEFLQPRKATTPISELELFEQIDAIPQFLTIEGDARRAVHDALARMADDMALSGPAPVLNALLRNQLQALLIRLHLAGGQADQADRAAPASLARFRSYRKAVERQYAQWHRAGQYANHLGCSQKSLNRASLELAGVSAKAYLTNRIMLEAKRLLAHTFLPVALIGDRLGFDEATNFVKAFRRETGTTPGKFRAREMGAEHAAR